MPWKNVSAMEQKQRFISLAGSGHFTMTELCRDFGISRQTGHKWVARHAEGGMKALEERSRFPKATRRSANQRVFLMGTSYPGRKRVPRRNFD
jgi:transposase-like protein